MLEAARSGDEGAFRQLVEPRHGELHAHCYRMLGSVHDAEDALQDAMLRAWRGLPRFDGRSSLRAWLYKIATNTCLDTIAKRPKRVLPLDYGPATDPSVGAGEPLIESVWVEPYPDQPMGMEDGMIAPDARYEQREGVELAFVAALQHLPANQRAVLILREVLGYSAKETAATLEVSTQSVNSALQRARKTIEHRLPERSQQATARELGDKRLRKIVQTYMDAMQRGDVPKVVAMLTADAAWSMPPLASWFGPRDQVADFLRLSPMSGQFRWRHVPTQANGQPAVGCYTWHEDKGAFLPFCIDVLTLEGDLIKEVTAFIVRPTEGVDDFSDFPDQDADPGQVADLFGRFGLPLSLAER